MVMFRRREEGDEADKKDLCPALFSVVSFLGEVVKDKYSKY
jgi:hypothetical protein